MPTSVSVIKAEQIDLFKAKISTDSTTQTDFPQWKSEKKCKSFLELPDWYWTGFDGVPNSIQWPEKAHWKTIRSKSLQSMKSLDSTLKISQSVVDFKKKARLFHRKSVDNSETSDTRNTNRFLDSLSKIRETGRRASQNPTTAKSGETPTPSEKSNLRRLSLPRGNAMRTSRSANFNQCRRGSIADQLEERSAQYNRNTVKKHVIQQLQRSFSKMTEDDHQPSSSVKAVSPQVRRNGSLISKSTTISHFHDIDDIVQPSVRPSTNRRDLLRDFSKDSASSSSSTPPKKESCPTEEPTQKPKLQLQRSFTYESFVNIPKKTSGAKLGWKLPKMLLPLTAEANRGRANKKNLEKMWGETYTGMCNRASVLNHVIQQAQEEELEVKPIHWSKDTENVSIPETKKKAKSSDQSEIYLGLSNQFYHVSRDCVDSSSEDLPCSSIQSEINKHFPPMMKARVHEIKFSKDVILQSLNCASSVRLNLRTRSIEAMNHSYLGRSSFVLGQSPFQPSKKSIIAPPSPSNIPRLIKRDSVVTKSADYLNLDFDEHLISSVGEPEDASYALQNSGALLTLENMHVLNNLLRGRADRCTQVNFFPSCSPFSHPHENDPFSSCSRSESPESRPVERQVEARSGSEDGLGSMVRCLHFANTYIANRKSKSKSC